MPTDADDTPAADETGTSTPPGASPHAPDRPVPREEPVLPDVSRDDLDVGWGDEPGGRDADWYRRERPPHHE